MTLTYNDFIIELTNDENYEVGSQDNINTYDYIYFADETAYKASSKHGIRITKDDGNVASALICGSSGGTGINDKSFIIKNDTLFICCSNLIYSLTLPHLHLNWATISDLATCFCIYEYDNDLLIHGEVNTTRLSLDGTIKWQFSARDIFVTLDESNEFEIKNDEIHLLDFEYNKYVLNSNGKLLKDIPNKKH